MNEDLAPIFDRPMMDFFPLVNPRPGQVRAVNFIQKAIERGYRDIVIEGPTGCHAPGQKVIMSDGTLKKVEDIRIGDSLMGPDSSPRTVIELHIGADNMLTVTPIKAGNPFTVNAGHTLSLQRTNDETHKAYAIDNITIKNYVLRSKTFKHIYKLYRTGVEFSEKHLLIPPYILGLWLGDGSSSGTSLTTADKEIESVWTNYATTLDLSVRCHTKPSNAASDFTISSGPKGLMHCPLNGRFKNTGANTFLTELRHYSLLGNKHIPQDYLSSNRQQRLELLAGLIDTDGSLSNNLFEYSSVSVKLADGVAFLARSLGFAVSHKVSKKSCQTGAVGIYQRLTIGGNLEVVPTLLPRKKASIRRQKKCVLRSGFSLTKAGYGNYFGFTLTGDGLYLLDDFTVTHNSGKSAIGAAVCYWAASMAGLFTEEGGLCVPGGYYLVTQKMLQDQLSHDITEYRFGRSCSLKSSSEYPCPRFKTCQCGLSATQSKCEHIGANSCPYRTTYSIFTQSDLSITNYPYFFTEKTYVGQLKPRSVIVCDEAHGLERQLLKFGELAVSDTFLKDWEIRLKSRPASEDREDICAWLESDYIPAAEEKKEVVKVLMEEGHYDAVGMRQATSLINHVQKLSFTLRNMRENPENWVTWKETDPKKGEIINARPLDAAPYIGLLTKSGAIRVYMSAYPGDKAVFCRSIGLDPDYVAWITLDSTFPAKNRPIVMGLIGSMGQKNIDQTLPALLRTCDKILNKHANQKGIVHCVTYKIGEQIASHFASTSHASRIIFPKSADDREDAFRQHTTSTEPTIIISPSMSEGFDFADDLSRFQILAKCPFPYLGDRQVAAKKEQDPAWYDAQTVSTIIQATGRIVRSEKDHGVSYILDSDFMFLWDKRKNFFPKWWRDAIVWGSSGRPPS